MAEAVGHRFTVDDYERMGEAGILTEDDRVELVAGEIVDKPVIGPRHAEGVRLCTKAFILRCGDRAEVSPQNPVRLPGVLSEPEPDVALLRPTPGGYGRRHPDPEDVLLIVEVADTSRRRDRDRKIPLYAAEGITEVWLVDVDARRVEVYRSPVGGRYADVTHVQPGGTVTPLAFPDVTIGAAELLPQS